MEGGNSRFKIFGGKSSNERSNHRRFHDNFTGIHSRGKKLTILRNANVESQQSLANAVARDQFLNDQIHDLTAQNNSLAEEILNLKEQNESVAKDLKEQLDASSQLEDTAYAIRAETADTQLETSCLAGRQNFKAQRFRMNSLL